MTAALAIAPLALVVLIGLLLVLLVRTRVDGEDVAWLVGSPLPAADEAEVTARYLRRHRTHRAVGGVVGVVLAVTIAVRWAGQIRLGVGGVTPLADPLFLGIGGVVVGALSAESFRLPRRGGPATASLQPRETGPGRRHRGWALGLAALAVLVVAGQALLDGQSPETARSSTALVLGLAVLALAELTRRRVLDRRRPALSDRARRLDERLRAFALASISRLQLAAAALTTAWAFSSITTPVGDSRVAREMLGAVQLAVVIAALVVAVVQLRRARPRPVRGHPLGALA